MSNMRSLDLLCIFLVTLFLFLWGVSGQEIIGFESRFYMFAQEMWRHGPSWFPLTYGRPYPDYPVTSTLLIHLAARSLGHLDKLSAVIPSAVAGAITVCLTYSIASMRNRWWGWYSVLMLLFTIAFFKAARTLSLDMYPTLFTAACFYLVYSADQQSKTERLGWIYFLFFLGFAFRGPIGLIMPAAVVCGYFFLSRQYKRLFFSAAFAFLILLLSMGIYLGISQAIEGADFVQQVVWMQVVGRMESFALPYYYYFLDAFASYAMSYPIAVVVFLGGVYYAWRLSVHTAELKLLFQLMAWVLVILVGMSVPGDKKIRYILPIAPALAIIASYPFIAPSDQTFFVRLRWLLTRILYVTPLVLLFGMSYVRSYLEARGIDARINYSRTNNVLSFILSMSFLGYFQLKNKLSWYYLCAMGVASTSFVWFYLAVAEPVMQYLDRSQEFVRLVEGMRSHDRAKLVFYKLHPDGLPIKYLINMQYDEHPLFVVTEQQLFALSEPAYFVTSEAYYDQLPAEMAARFKIVARDKIGHVAVVVFSNR